MRRSYRLRKVMKVFKISGKAQISKNSKVHKIKNVQTVKRGRKVKMDEKCQESCYLWYSGRLLPALSCPPGITRSCSQVPWSMCDMTSWALTFTWSQLQELWGEWWSFWSQLYYPSFPHQWDRTSWYSPNQREYHEHCTSHWPSFWSCPLDQEWCC